MTRTATGCRPQNGCGAPTLHPPTGYAVSYLLPERSFPLLQHPRSLSSCPDVPCPALIQPALPAETANGTDVVARFAHLLLIFEHLFRSAETAFGSRWQFCHLPSSSTMPTSAAEAALQACS